MNATPLLDLDLMRSTEDRIVDASPFGHPCANEDCRLSDSSNGLRAIFFDGRSRLAIRGSLAAGMRFPFWIETCAKGTGSGLQWQELTAGTPTRDPHFQVVGERIYLATNTDVPHHTLRKRKRWDLVTGWLDTNGKTRELTIHASEELEALRPETGLLEPKLQVVGNRIHYLFFGIQKGKGRSDLFTASSGKEGRSLEVTCRTGNQASGCHVEQGAMQVLGGTAHCAFPQQDSLGRWQLMTARLDLASGAWSASQRTRDGGWVPSLQATENGLLILYGRYRKTHPQNLLRVARMSEDGTDFREILRIEGELSCPWARFLVSERRIYVSYALASGPDASALRLAICSLEGERISDQLCASDGSSISPAMIRRLGERCYFVYHRKEKRDLPGEQKKPSELWVATTDLDGRGWSARKISSNGCSFLSNYGSLQIVGGRCHWFANAVRDIVLDQRMVYGFSGCNLVSRGGDFGLGITEDGQAMAFSHCGPEYLFEAGVGAGAYRSCVLQPIDESWHHFVVGFAESKLALWIDGLKVGECPSFHVTDSTLPLLVGDGFVGAMAQLEIGSGVIEQEEVTRKYLQAKDKLAALGEHS